MTLSGVKKNRSTFVSVPAFCDSGRMERQTLRDRGLVIFKAFWKEASETTTTAWRLTLYLSLDPLILLFLPLLAMILDLSMTTTHIIYTQ